MHRREITQEQFDAIAIELQAAATYPANFTMIVGRHEDLGRTVLLATPHVRFALVTDPSCLDMVLAARPQARLCNEQSAFDHRA